MTVNEYTPTEWCSSCLEITPIYVDVIPDGDGILMGVERCSKCEEIINDKRNTSGTS